jgi:hypothetical protein
LVPRIRWSWSLTPPWSPWSPPSTWLDAPFTAIFLEWDKNWISKRYNMI